VERVDYLELDPALIQAIARYAPEATLRELHDPRVTLLSKDGRAFLRDSDDRYDVILIDKPLPQNLQGNRYFTVEFMAALKRVLHADGIIAAMATGSMSYYGDDLKEVTRSFLQTIGSTFPHILVVPGDRNLFVASARRPLETLGGDELFRRFEARGVQAALISGQHLHWLLHSTPRQWFKENVGEGGRVNSDFSPYLLTRHLSYVTTQLSPEMKPLLELFARIRTVHAAAVFMVLTLAVLCISRGRRRPAVLWTMTTSGFSAMLLELAFFFIYQLFQGIMLQTIGLLIAIFMAGLWGGSRVTAPPPAVPESDRQRLMAGDVTLLLLSAILYGISSGTVLSPASSDALICLTVLPLIFFAGFSAGMQFPPATRLTADASGPGTSLVYGCDLLGGWLGGLLGGVLLLPLLGFAQTALLLLLLKGGSILCLYLQRE
jgi:spermidine synthase